MTTAAEYNEQQLKKWLGVLLASIDLGSGLDRQAWNHVDAASMLLVSSLKGMALVPKSPLRELRVAAKILRAEALHHGEREFLLEMADKLELALDLIIIDEEHGDRVPGVPRII